MDYKSVPTVRFVLYHILLILVECKKTGVLKTLFSNPLKQNSRLFAIGDIHGCFQPFKQLIETKINLKPTDKLILIGDYIDRGPESKDVIDYIIHLQKNGFDIVPLLGNHEAMLLEAYVNKDKILTWLFNGGAETLKSFKISNLLDIDSVYIDFFRSLPHYYSLNEFLFVHAGFNDKITDPFEDKYTMLWHCSKKYANTILKEKVIVHGHRPQKADALVHTIASDRNIINIDTGCVYADKEGYGKLTAIDINTFAITSF